jgi:hypothetical protein
MFKLDVSYTVVEFVEDVLKNRFPGDPLRQEINDTDEDKLNFACPYCGDSLTDPNKKRGNLYLRTQTYKCYNDGCSTWVPLEKFISKFALKYALGVPGVEKKKVEYKPATSIKKKGFLIEFLINREVGKQLLVFSEVVDRFSLIPCKDAESDSPIGKFIEKRKINKLPVFEQSCYYDSRQDKVYIFNLDLKSGKIIGFALRRIDDDYPGPKYDIKNYTEFKKNGLVPELDDDFITQVNSLNNYFNILNINFTQKITITEGQIDSMFVRNCIATTGVTKSKQLLASLVTKENSRIFFDNDKAGKCASIELLMKGYSVFLWNLLITDLRKTYPALTKEINTKIKDVNDLFRFMLNQQPALTFNEFNETLDKYFSDSAFDLLLV